jgi:hypothetical protein
MTTESPHAQPYPCLYQINTRVWLTQGRGLFLDVPPWHYHVFEIHATYGDLL